MMTVWSMFRLTTSSSPSQTEHSLTSTTHVSALSMTPLGAHLGSEPRLSRSRVVLSLPVEGSSERERTSAVTTCGESGLGNRSANPSATEANE